jgi:hypothetical protein
MTVLDEYEKMYRSAEFGEECPSMAVTSLGACRHFAASVDDLRGDIKTFLENTKDLSPDLSVTITSRTISLSSGRVQ